MTGHKTATYLLTGMSGPVGFKIDRHMCPGDLRMCWMDGVVDGVMDGAVNGEVEKVVDGWQGGWSGVW